MRKIVSDLLLDPTLLLVTHTVRFLERILHIDVPTPYFLFPVGLFAHLHEMQ